MKNNVVDSALNLTKELVAIPSFDEETKLAEFIIAYIKKNLSWLKIFRENIEGTKRFNVIAYNSTKPELVFVSHMDTVKPIGNSEIRFNPTIKNGKLFGLGSVDMKSGLACSLIAAQFSDSTKPIALVFDCDEEYYFSGIKQFIKDYQQGVLPLDSKIKPKLVIFPEPSDLKIVAGCRGCVEIAFRVIGKSAHAGRPDLGINAIEKGVELVNKLKTILTTGTSVNQIGENPLGKTTINLAGLNGGVLQNNQIMLQANAISDVADLLLDIRTSKSEQTAEYIVKKLKPIAQSLNIRLENIQVNLDLQGYLNEGFGLNLLEKSMQKVLGNVDYKNDLSDSGYGEIAMLGKQLDWNTVNFGPGSGNTSHTIDEALNIKDLRVVVDVYQEIIKLLGNK